MRTEDKKPNIDRKKTLKSSPVINIVFALDVSDSMGWENGINDLNDGMNTFIDTLKKDKYASSSAIIDILTFNHEVKHIVSSANVNDINLPTLTAGGGTDLAKAINDALDIVKEQYKKHAKEKQKTKTSWVVIFTDAEIESGDIDEVVKRINKMIDNSDIILFPIGTGNNVNTKELKRLDPNKPIIFSPSGETLKPLFQWISKSLSKYSKTQNGTKSKTEELDRRYELY